MSKKSLTDFFDKLQPPSILLRAKCYYPKSPDFSRLFGRRFIQLEAGLAPSSSPCGPIVLHVRRFFDSLRMPADRSLRVFSQVYYKHSDHKKTSPLLWAGLFICGLGGDLSCHRSYRRRLHRPVRRRSDSFIPGRNTPLKAALSTLSP